MKPTFNEHKELINKIMNQIRHDVRNVELVENKFSRPLETENGFRTSNDNPDIVVDWFRSLEKIYGKSLEGLENSSELMNHLKIFYQSSDEPPPQLNGGDWCFEVKVFLSDILNSYTDAKGKYLIPDSDEIPKVSYQFLTRNEDEYFVDVPLLGIKISKPLKFKHGELIPLNFNQRVDLARERVGHDDPRSLLLTSRLYSAQTLLRISVKWPRSERSILICPTSLQTISDNTVQLLNAFSYGGIHACFQSFYWSAIGKRGSGTVSNGSNTFGSQARPTDEDALIEFLNTHVDEKSLDEHELGFVMNRLSEAWSRQRTNEFLVFDYVTMLEAMLVKSRSLEKSFKVSIYVAHLLAAANEDKKIIFDLIRKAYGVRNAIAHCEASIKERERLSEEELKKLGKIVHTVIRRAFDCGLGKLRSDAKDVILT